MLEDEIITVSQKALRKGAHRIADRIFEKTHRRARGFRYAHCLHCRGRRATEPALPADRRRCRRRKRGGCRAWQPAASCRRPGRRMASGWPTCPSRRACPPSMCSVCAPASCGQVSARAGVNGAPTYSPDGKQLALTLSGSAGNLDIYVLDLATQNLTRITDDPAIDTEPAWSPDGKTLYFTSDRGGAPQIYATEARSGARAAPHHVSACPMRPGRGSRPTASNWPSMTQEGGAFRIATLDLASGNITSLSRGALDESPSFAPNGAMLIYAGRERGQGVLATVSVDGQVTARLQVQTRAKCASPCGDHSRIEYDVGQASGYAGHRSSGEAETISGDDCGGSACRRLQEQARAGGVIDRHARAHAARRRLRCSTQRCGDSQHGSALGQHRRRQRSQQPAGRAAHHLFRFRQQRYPQ